MLFGEDGFKLADFSILTENLNHPKDSEFAVPIQMNISE
jgi:hypothetical protein